MACHVTDSQVLLTAILIIWRAKNNPNDKHDINTNHSKFPKEKNILLGFEPIICMS